jgi:hypothetical protein
VPTGDEVADWAVAGTTDVTTTPATMQAISNMAHQLQRPCFAANRCSAEIPRYHWVMPMSTGVASTSASGSGTGLQATLAAMSAAQGEAAEIAGKQT